MRGTLSCCLCCCCSRVGLGGCAPPGLAEPVLEEDLLGCPVAELALTPRGTDGQLFLAFGPDGVEGGVEEVSRTAAPAELMRGRPDPLPPRGLGGGRSSASSFCSAPEASYWRRQRRSWLSTSRHAVPKVSRVVTICPKNWSEVGGRAPCFTETPKYACASLTALSAPCSSALKFVSSCSTAAVSFSSLSRHPSSGGRRWAACFRN
mmetsp:Transcript_55036/g.170513  ORF Transcript_55036/g.170513 Transcript_55036/m.170513 type:complete len:206 (-) Transcript_55036:503-1120(-)